MKKLLFSFITLAILLTSCGPDPVKYNDTLVDYSKKAIENYDLIAESLNEANESDDYSKMANISQAVVDSINMRIDAIKALETPSGAEDFQKAVVKYLEALTDVAKAYSGFTILDDENVTDEQVTGVVSTIEEKDKVLADLIQEVNDAQVAFAKAKNFELK